MPRRRLLLLGASLLIVFGALVFVSERMGLLGGVSVQVFDPNATVFDSHGVLVCTSDRAWVGSQEQPELSFMHILSDTAILDQRTSFIPTPARITDLRVGQHLRVWKQPGALFSFPSQVYAERLVIEDDGQPTALDCQWPHLGP